MNIPKEIYEKYPKVWDMIRQKYREKPITDLEEEPLYIDITGHEISLLETSENIAYIMPFNFLYALLEDFFEENGIIIEITVQDKDFFTYELRDDEGNGYSIGVFIRTCDTKNEAKSQAILKACEILQEQL